MKSLLKMLTLVLLCGGTISVFANETEDSDSAKNDSAKLEFKFEAPVELLADGESIKGTGYPSPTLYDIDNDGRSELIVGDIMGNIFTCNKSSESSVSKWDEMENLEANGKPVKLNNW